MLWAYRILVVNDGQVEKSHWVQEDVPSLEGMAVKTVLATLGGTGWELVTSNRDASNREYLYLKRQRQS